MTTFLLVRHGTTDAIGQYFAGRAPGVTLSAAGQAEVAALADRLRSVGLTAVVSSPLERTRETADRIAAACGLTVDTDDALIEFDFGSWTGARFAELSQDALWARFNSARMLTAAPGGELMLDVQQRAVKALLGLASKYDGGRVAVVSHGDVIRSAIMYFLGVPLDFVHRIDIAPARVSIVDISADAVRVRQVNGDTASLIG